MPARFKNYVVRKDDCASFDWAERDKQGRPLTVESTKGEPIGNVPNFTITYTRREEDMQPQMDSILLEIRDGFRHPKRVAAAGFRESRLNDTKSLQVLLITNYHAKRDIAVQYAIVTKPARLPVPGASFAMLYTVPTDKVMLTRDGVAKAGAETPERVADHATIIFGATPKVVTDPTDDNVTFAIDRVYTRDAVTNLTTQPTQNVVLMVSGDAADIRALIAMIDWTSIAALRKPSS